MAYKGAVVEIPLGTDGLTGTKNLSQAPPGYLSEATNVCYHDGTVRKEGGAAKFNATAITAAPTILGGFEHRTNALAQRTLIACSDGKLYKDTGDTTFSVTLKTGLSTSMRPYFVEAGKEAAANDRKTFVFTGTNVVQVLADDGATTGDIATPPSDWASTNQPTFGLHHNFRLMGAGNANDPHRLYYSDPDDHEDFSTAQAGSLAIYPGEGEALVAGFSWKGRVILFKRPRGIYVVNMESAVTNDWTVERLSSSVGMASPWAWAQTESDIVFMDSTGAVQSLTSTLSNLGEVEGRSLGQTADLDALLRNEIKLSELDEVRAVFYVARREIHFAYTRSTGTVNNSRLVLDLNRPDKVRFRLSPRDVCTAMWLRRDTNGIPRIQVGDNAGFVRTLDQDTRSKDGAGYPARFTTVPTDLGYADGALAHKKKNAAFLELIYEPTAFNAVQCTLNWDNQRQETVNFTLATSGTALGSFVLGTHQLGSSGYNSIRRRITGGGKYVSLSFFNSAAAEDFSIARAKLYFKPGAE